jgi:hypothetical protein
VSLDHSQDNVKLLSQVLCTLEEGRSISVTTNRLYEVYKVFLRFVIAFIWSRQNCFGPYNQEDDFFTFLIIGIGSTTVRCTPYRVKQSTSDGRTVKGYDVAGGSLGVRCSETVYSIVNAD